MLKPPTHARAVTGISQDDRREIRAFLQGAVYCWCKARPREWFALSDLVGGENFLWEGTPLAVLRRKHQGRAQDPFRAASVDAGRMLKQVIIDDRRVFEEDHRNLVRLYRWTGDYGLIA